MAKIIKIEEQLEKLGCINLKKVSWWYEFDFKKHHYRLEPNLWGKQKETLYALWKNNKIILTDKKVDQCLEKFTLDQKGKK